MLLINLIKKIGKIIPGRLGEELVGFSVRRGKVRRTMRRTIIMAIKYQNLFLGKRNLKILIVGTASYSKYDAVQIGNENDEIWTMDIEEHNKVYGVKNGKHIVGSATELEKYFDKNYFDIVIVNGVIGWGIDKYNDQINTIKGIYHISNNNAMLMIGWNNNKSIDPLISGITSKFYNHQDFPGLPKRILVTESTHVFDFFIKI